MKAKDSHPLRSLPTEGAIEYPAEDGKPMAETDVHRDVMVDMILTLRHRYRNRLDVYVSGDLLMYYKEGNPLKSVAPDVFVVFGVEKKQRRTYLLWEEGKGPDFVIELASKSTVRNDLTYKKDLYAQVLGVEEYYIHDPEGLSLSPSLQGFRLVNGVYQEIQPVNNRFACETLGLEIGERTGELRLYDPQAKDWVLTPVEEAQTTIQQVETRAQREIRARHAAEERAAQESRERHAAEERAAQESRVRQAVEAENARLRAELERLRTA